MKRLWIVLVLAVLLTGCSAQQTFETFLDTCDVPALAQIQQLQLSLPEEASVMTMDAGDNGKLYLCDGYTVTVQTLLSGDLQQTLQETTGFLPAQLQMIQTEVGDTMRYDCVWSAAGEGGDQIGRAAILDDGSYHYVVTAMADATSGGDMTQAWNELFGSIKLVSTD